MPIYEYRCLKCGSVFEVLEKNSDAERTVHEGCGGKLERLLSPPALQFKGSGWYVTDYARASASSRSDSSEESKPKEKSETKPKTDSGGGKSEEKT